IDADMAELCPGARRTAGRTVAFSHADYHEVFRVWRVLLNLSAVVWRGAPLAMLRGRLYDGGLTTLLARLQAAVADDYSVACEIGRGGMATVYLGDDLKLERRVAIKLLHPQLATGLGV